VKVVLFESNKELALFPWPYLLEHGNVQELHFILHNNHPQNALTKNNGTLQCPNKSYIESS